MKIGFFGNQNNAPFILARAMRNQGHDVVFIVDRSPETFAGLFRPESFYPDITIPYPDWIHDLSPLLLMSPVTDATCLGNKRLGSWLNLGLLATGIRTHPSKKLATVLRLLRDCDAVILNDVGLTLAKLINRPHLAILTGADLEPFATYEYVEQRLSEMPFDGVTGKIARRLTHRFLHRQVTAQREGIRTARAVHYPTRGLIPRADGVLDEIGVDNAQRMFLMGIDVHRIKESPPPNNKTPRVFYTGRINWDKTAEPLPSEIDYKGNDVMIRGLGDYVRRSGAAIDIRLVRKGSHLPQTDELIEAEGLTKFVTWEKQMSQSEVFEQNRKADIVFDQFAGSLVGMGGLEAMATGRPLIANGRPDIVDSVLEGKIPICQAKTPQEVSAQLQRLLEGPAERARVGRISRAYVARFLSSEQAAQTCLDRLGVVKSSK